MFQNHPVYNPEDLHPEVIELITSYEDLIATQIALLGLKGVTKGQPKHLKTHLLSEQKELLKHIEELRENLLPLHF